MATAYLFVFPAEDAVPARADAVVVLAGGRIERLAEGRRLVREGVAPLLAISDGRARDWPAANRLCGRRGVRCFDAKPFSTQGEARWTARQGWDSVVVVTSTYHVRRTRLLFERCAGGRVTVVGAEPDLDNFAVGALWEWPKLGYALTVERGC